MTISTNYPVAGTQQSGALQPSRRNVVIFGDSITAQNTDVTPTGWTLLDWRGYFRHANMRLSESLVLVANCGLNGDTTTGMLSRLGSGSVLSASPDPLAFTHDLCIVVGGTNDINSAVTTSSANSQALVIINNLKAIVTKLQNSGILVVLSTIPPRNGDSAASTLLGGIQRSMRRQINSWIRQYCESKNGPILFDFFHAVSNSATEQYITNATIDGTHPNFQGASYMGSVLATALTPYIQITDTGGVDQFEWYAGNGSAQGSNASGTNGTILGTGITGSAPSGWNIQPSATGAAVGSLIVPATGSLLQDRKLRMAITATANYDGANVRIGGTEYTSNQTAWAVANSFSGSRWTGSSAVNITDKCIPGAGVAVSAYGGLWAVCVQSGTTGSTEPTWPTTPGQQVTDNSCIWEMVTSPFAVQRSQHWASAFYVGLGAIVRPSTPSGFYYQCTTAGLTAAAADPAYNNTLGATTSDGTAVWTTIAIPNYSYYAEFDFATSSLTAGAGCLIQAFLRVVDDGGTTSIVYASNVDVTPGNFSTNSSATTPPASGRLRTPVFTLGANKGMRYLNAEIGAYLDASATMNFDVSRISIRPVITL